MENLQMIAAARDSWESSAKSLAKALKRFTEKIYTNVDMTACEVIGEYWEAVEALRAYEAVLDPSLSVKQKKS